MQRRTHCRLAAAIALCIAAQHVHAQQSTKESTDARIQRLESQLQAQTQRLDALEKTVTERDFEIAELRQAMGLDDMRARGTASTAPAAPAQAQQQQAQQQQAQQQSQ